MHTETWSEMVSIPSTCVLWDISRTAATSEVFGFVQKPEKELELQESQTCKWKTFRSRAEHDLLKTSHEFSTLVQAMLLSSFAKHVVSIVVKPHTPHPSPSTTSLWTELRCLLFSCCVSVGGNGMAWLWHQTLAGRITSSNDVFWTNFWCQAFKCPGTFYNFGSKTC